MLKTPKRKFFAGKKWLDVLIINKLTEIAVSLYFYYKVTNFLCNLYLLYWIFFSFSKVFVSFFESCSQVFQVCSHVPLWDARDQLKLYFKSATKQRNRLFKRIAKLPYDNKRLFKHINIFSLKIKILFVKKKKKNY